MSWSQKTCFQLSELNVSGHPHIRTYGKGGESTAARTGMVTLLESWQKLRLRSPHPGKMWLPPFTKKTTNTHPLSRIPLQTFIRLGINDCS